MKKIILLVMPFLLFVASCDDTRIIKKDDTTAKKDNDGHGTGHLPAQIWEEVKETPINGVKVEAQLNGVTKDVATTNDQGMYSYTKLTAGTTYSYKASKTGYVTQQISALYDGTPSLPGFALKLK